MENRRQDYRFTFAAEDQPRVELMAAGQRAAIAARIINLSAGGLGIQVSAATPLPSRMRCQASFELYPGDKPMTVPALIVHSDPAADTVGLRFLAVPEPAGMEARERVLRRFVFAAQARQRRQEQEAG